MAYLTSNQIANSNIHYRFYPLNKFFQCQKQLGIQNIDLFGAAPHIWIDAYSASSGIEIRKQSKMYGLTISTFIPEFSSMRYTLGSEGDSGEKAWEYIKRCFLFANEMGTNQVVINANGFLLDRDEEKRWERFINILYRISNLAREQGAVVLLMPHFADYTNMLRTRKDMEHCLQMINVNWMKPAIDTASVYEAEESLEDWFLCFGEQIGYINLSNTMFDGERHCWGDGYLNLWEIMKIIKQNQYQGAAGTFYMTRDYLAKPWKADSLTREMLRMTY